MEGLASFEQIDATPCLVLEYTSASATAELVAAVAERLQSESRARPVIWLTYNGFHQRGAVDGLIEAARSEHGLEIQPIMMP